MASTILVVDDNADNRNILCRRLIKNGYDIFESTDSSGVLERLEKEKIDLILLDIMMPEVDGFDLLKQIRNDYSPYEMPVIMVTALVEDEAVITALKCGANDYIMKPLNFSVVLARIKTQLKLSRFEKKFSQEARTKSDFLARMSHEIRTPLNSILGVSDLILEKSCDNQIRKYAQIQQRSGEVLMSIIDDILDFTKGDEGKLCLQSIDFELKEALQSCADVMRLRVEEKGIKFELVFENGLSKYFRGDVDRLKQILINLIGNAFKFTEKGSIQLNVSQESVHESGCVLLFAVKDTGIGVPKENFGQIFKKFEQGLKSTAQNYGGTGLGLPICKNLIELMGGKIWIESEIGEGSTFYFTVKFDTAVEVLNCERETSKKVLLLVEDERELHRNIKELLSNYDFHIISAFDGEEALNILKNEPVDTVLSDIKMPKMDGLDLYFEVKKLVPKTPFIFISGHVSSGAVEKALEISNVDFFSKPFENQDVFCETVRLAVDCGFEMRRFRKQRNISSTEILKILLVEDIADNVELLKIFLQDTPCEIEAAENGEIGFNKFKAGEYDLVLMDMQMPVLDGFESTRKIRRWEQTQGRRPVTIIGLSANVGRAEVEKSLNSGCTSYLSKPIKKIKLLDKIEESSREHKVLIAEDESDLRALLVKQLDGLGYEVFLAENGTAAYRICENAAIDLLLTDILMPEKDGIDLIKELQVDFPHIATIAFSGNSAKLDIAKGLGVQQTLQKPFDFDQVREAVIKTLDATNNQAA